MFMFTFISNGLTSTYKLLLMVIWWRSLFESFSSLLEFQDSFPWSLQERMLK
ncbi:FMRFamide receptor, partial [Biomphalaria pfeifferi]